MKTSPPSRWELDSSRATDGEQVGEHLVIKRQWWEVGSPGIEQAMEPILPLLSFSLLVQICAGRAALSLPLDERSSSLKTLLPH